MKRIFSILLLSILLFSCCLNDKSIESKIVSELQDIKELNLSNYNDFDWDSVIILNPYSNIEKIEKEKDINLSDVSTSIERLDNINLVVFLKNGKAVKYSEVHRSIADFDNYQDIIEKQNANFKLISDLKDNCTSSK